MTMVCMKDGCEWMVGWVCSRDCPQAVDRRTALARQKLPPSPCDSCPRVKRFRCNGAICPRYEWWVKECLGQLKEVFGDAAIHPAE